MALICQPPWWAYVIMAPCAFFLCLLLNCIVNRINAARIEERYAQFLAKEYSSNQGTQSQQERMMRMETPKRAASSPTCMQTLPVEGTQVFPPEKAHDPKESEPLPQTMVTKPNDVVSTSKVVNIASDPIILQKTYIVQLASSKSLDKLEAPNQENQSVENEIVSSDEQQNPNKEPELQTETVVKKPSDAVSAANVVNIASNPIFLRKVYNVSSKSIDKQTVTLKQETQNVGKEIDCEMKKKAKDCESAPAFKRMMNDQDENKLRDWVSDTTIRISNKEINKDTGF